MLYIFRGGNLINKCILFRISNKVFQANFYDGSKIFVWSSSPIACFKPSNGDTIVKNMATEKNLKISHPSFHKRIQYVRNLLIQIIINKNSNLDQLDKHYEETEYLKSQNLETNGRKANFERQWAKEQSSKIESKKYLKELLCDKENKDKSNKLDRFSKLKLGGRIETMMSIKYALNEE